MRSAERHIPTARPEDAEGVAAALQEVQTIDH